MYQLVAAEPPRAPTPNSARRADEEFWAQLELAERRWASSPGGWAACRFRAALLDDKTRLTGKALSARSGVPTGERHAAKTADAGRCQSVPLPESAHESTHEPPPAMAATVPGPPPAVAAGIRSRGGSTADSRPSLTKRMSITELISKGSGACELARSCCGRRGSRPTSAQSSRCVDQPVTPARTMTDSRMKHHATGGGDSRQGSAQGKSELTVFQAHDLALRFNLPTGLVTQAWKLFKRYDRHGRGLLGIEEFQMLLRSLVRDRYPEAKDVPRELFCRLSDQTKDVDFTEFLTWISRNSFNELLLLTPSQRAIRDIARKFDKPVPFVEAIKREFDRFDADRSGIIEYEEFCKLLVLLLNVSDTEALPESRIRTFWRELDFNGTGEVEFGEFIPWYLNYFDRTGGLPGTSPLEEFYRKIRPVPFQINSG
eukprot:CAMPEP_0175391928 /NCGR_PEP_ID=MMETSP0095-20121207/32161_1 /TAXON_ID=311494 /ORGANISM="Alexandrium monilatum, Strain CCMP3105" /LENGTH=428 /DNA_ID=CAMNT_0016690493 /DNA_START=9 /DNA_END=1292 /DNA_ORIENTATION=-